MKKEQMIQAEIETRIAELMQKMTLEEKAGQLNQVHPGFESSEYMLASVSDDPSSNIEEQGRQMNYHEADIRAGLIGSMLGVRGVETINRLQKIAVEESRLGIPLLFGMDVIHGYRTIFPIPLAEACSWEPELAEKSAAVAAKEASAAGLHWTFAPMVDIARDARWGRIAEGAGEDAFLGSQMAAARVRGFQGEDFSQPDKLLACAKHYVAYGAAEAGRDYNRTELSPQSLHETYLPPFQAAVDAGVGTVMSAFNELNGVPTSANHYTLTTVLREEMGFNGFVVSDYDSIGELIQHGFAEDRKDAVRKALEAGVDIDMMTQGYRNDIPTLVKEGLLSMAVVDEAVRRVLRIKYLAGLFDQPGCSDAAKEAQTLLHHEHLAAARDAARRSFVLLKNEGDLLPLPKTGKQIALIGPLADNKPDLLGSWSFTGSSRDVVSIAEGLRAAGLTDLLMVEGCSISGMEEDFSAALASAAQADVIVAALGESADMSGEAGSRLELGLPGRQQALLEALHATGKPIVLLLVSGRPLALPWAAVHVDAILEIWQPGTQGGHAVADVLLGNYNPSGKLTVSIPVAVGQCPIYYNHPSTGRPATDFKFTSKYVDGPVEPLYPFGFGLSYTRFEYESVYLSHNEVSREDGMLPLRVTVRNIGSCRGEEVVQVYVADLVASRVRPVKELKAFQKVKLQAGESREIRFLINVQDLGFYNEMMQYVVEPGAFKLWVGPNSAEGLEADFRVL